MSFKRRKNRFVTARRKIRRAVEIVMDSYKEEIETLEDMENVMGCINTQLNNFTGVNIFNVEYDRMKEQIVINSRFSDGSEFPTRVLVGKWIKKTPIRRFDFDF